MASSQRLVRGRRAARTLALQVLFEVDTTGHGPQEVLARRLAEDGLDPEAAKYAEGLVNGVLRHVEAIDGLIQKAAPAWPFTQMAGIDRNIIRIALYEALFQPEKVPFKVAVNEAVELAKKFGSESSGRFVNGVVGRIVSQEIAKSEGDNPPEDTTQ
ncbi:MAG: transcription antitermination factor NusB [Sphingomonadaceae bacterium]